MHSAAANTPMIAPRSVIVTRAATIQHQDRIRVGFAYLTRKAASRACTLLSAFTSEATAAASFFGAVFTAAVALDKTSLSSGERRRDSINRNKQIRRDHMGQRIKVCTDRILPKDLMRLQPTGPHT